MTHAKPWNPRDLASSLVRAAEAAPMLEPETEREYLRRIREDDDPRALQALLVSHLRLVLSVARRYAGRGVSFADLVSEGNLALVEAARRFDPAHGARFATYAAWWVRALVSRHALATRRIVGPPSTRAARRLLSSLRETERRLRAELGRAPTRVELAAALDVAPSDVETVESALSGGDVSLSSGPEGRPRDLVSNGPTPEQVAEAREVAEHNRRHVGHALGCLEAREREIVERRLLSDERESLVRVGDDLGLSRERVRQLEVRARGKLREALLEHVA